MDKSAIVRTKKLLESRLVIGMVIMLLIALTSFSELQAEPNDADALAHDKRGRVVWDINMNDPKTLSFYLQVMKKTYDDLKKQGVEPEMIFTFRGKSVKNVSTQEGLFPMEKAAWLDEIHETLAALQQLPGVRLEACSIATGAFGVKGDTLVKGVKLVGNTFVSLIGYQAQGYAIIPIH